MLPVMSLKDDGQGVEVTSEICKGFTRSGITTQLNTIIAT